MELGFLLREAVYELNIRGLTLASRFLCEQLLGLNTQEDAISGEENFDSQDERLSEPKQLCSGLEDLVLFGNTLVLLGEFQRCANLIRSRKGKELFADCSMPHTKGLRELQFLAAYSCYMAGENIKD